MARKYSKELLATLSRDSFVDPSRRAVINHLQNTSFSGLSKTSDIVDKYVELRKKKAVIDAKLKDVNLLLEAIGEMLIKQYEAQGIDTMRLVSGASVAVNPEPKVRVTDPDACREWAKKEGLERLLSIPWQTLNSMAKERLLSGDPFPEGTELKTRDKIVYRKPRGASDVEESDIDDFSYEVEREAEDTDGYDN